MAHLTPSYADFVIYLTCYTNSNVTLNCQLHIVGKVRCTAKNIIHVKLHKHIWAGTRYSLVDHFNLYFKFNCNHTLKLSTTCSRKSKTYSSLSKITTHVKLPKHICMGTWSSLADHFNVTSCSTISDFVCVPTKLFIVPSWTEKKMVNIDYCIILYFLQSEILSKEHIILRYFTKDQIVLWMKKDFCWYKQVLYLWYFCRKPAKLLHHE